MKGSIRKWNQALLCTIVIWGVAFAALLLYTKQTTFPHGALWGEWNIAGMREVEFREELELRMETWLQSRIRFVLPEGMETSSTTTALGVAGAGERVEAGRSYVSIGATDRSDASIGATDRSDANIGAARQSDVSIGAASATNESNEVTRASDGAIGAKRMSASVGAVSSFGWAGATAEVTGTFSLAELGLSVDIAELEAAAELLFRGSMLKRAQARLSMRDMHVPLVLHVSSTAPLRAIGALWPQLLHAHPQEARRVITADDKVGYIPGKSAVQVDADALFTELSSVAEQLFRTLTAPPQPTGLSITTAAFAKLAPETKLLAEPTVIILPLQSIAPSVTIDTLKAEGIDRKIAEFSTFFPTSGEGRKHNIRSTATTVHDTILKPSEEFDYSEIIRQTQKQFGFKEAPVILNGKLVPGIGGGICQVSTTLYNAVLRAGIQITERRNHSLPVSYVPLGQDATFAEGWINFRFRNTTGSHLLIRTDVTEMGITVKLFGRMADGLSYEVVSNTVQTIAPPIKVVVNPTLANGQQELLQEGKTGYVVETYRIRKMNGVEESRELVSKDTYLPQPTLVARNKQLSPQPTPTKEQPKEKRNMLEDGISGPTFSSMPGFLMQ